MNSHICPMSPKIPPFSKMTINDIDFNRYVIDMDFFGLKYNSPLNNNKILIFINDKPNSTKSFHISDWQHFAKSKFYSNWFVYVLEFCDSTTNEQIINVFKKYMLQVWQDDTYKSCDREKELCIPENFNPNLLSVINFTTNKVENNEFCYQDEMNFGMTSGRLLPDRYVEHKFENMTYTVHVVKKQELGHYNFGVGSDLILIENIIFISDQAITEHRIHFRNVKNIKLSDITNDDEFDELHFLQVCSVESDMDLLGVYRNFVIEKFGESYQNFPEIDDFEFDDNLYSSDIICINTETKTIFNL